MSIRILIYLSLLFIGGILSYKKLVKEKLYKKISKIQLFFLYILIFIMGMRLGMDKQVLGSIRSIGFKSFVFALFTVVFSIILVCFTSKYIIKFKDIEGKRNDN